MWLTSPVVVEVGCLNRNQERGCLKQERGCLKQERGWGVRLKGFRGGADGACRDG